MVDGGSSFNKRRQEKKRKISLALFLLSSLIETFYTKNILCIVQNAAINAIVMDKGITTLER